MTHVPKDFTAKDASLYVLMLVRTNCATKTAGTAKHATTPDTACSARSCAHVVIGVTRTVTVPKVRSVALVQQMLSSDGYYFTSEHQTC